MITLFVSTRNRHKLDELRSMLPASIRVLGVDVLGEVPEMEEPEPTFEGNARAKAEGLARFISQQGLTLAEKWGGYPLWVLADDSGLAVDYLHGEPGVHSARFAWAGPEGRGRQGNAPDAENNAKLLRLLAGVAPEKRKAQFVCVLALLEIRSATERGSCFVVEGRCPGSIRESAGGAGGFGYDPLFQPEGYSVTFAQLTADEKNRISHRSRALNQLLKTGPVSFLEPRR